MNTKSTELDFTEKDHPEDTRHLSLMMITGILIGFTCGFGIVFTILNGEMIDNIKPEYQIVILAVSFAIFGIVRLFIWFRQKF